MSNNAFYFRVEYRLLMVEAEAYIASAIVVR
jgi:hypothetical protein